MSKKIISKEDLEKQFDKLYQDEIKFTIVTALELYETLNLKRLAKLIEKPESSTIRYLKKMLDEKLIEIDAEKTASSWGKFYKLSPEIRAISEKKKIENDQKLDEFQKVFGSYSQTKNEDLSKLIIKHILEKSDLEDLDLQLKQNIAFIHNFQKLIIGEFSNAHEELMKQIQEKGKEFVINNIELKPSDVSIFTGTIQVGNFAQLFRLLESVFRFVDEIEELKEQFKKEMDSENIPEEDRINQHVQLFTGSLEYGGKLRKEMKK